MEYQDFSFYCKIMSSSRSVKILFLSFMCEDIGVAMVTNMISQLQESFPLRRAVDFLEISSVKINKQNITWPLGFQSVTCSFSVHAELSAKLEAILT